MHHAQQFTSLLIKEQYNTTNHDVGFQMFCSYGNGLRLINDSNYIPILVQTAKSLMTRYHQKIGCIKSWDGTGWAFPVIIDNLMNLELLFWAGKNTGESHYYQAAFSHMEKTLKNHFRSDDSCYHVIDYDPSTGKVIEGDTAQGYSKDSVWARGQAWGLYGLTLGYRETGDVRFLDKSEKIAGFLWNHPNLPDDKIPYWDFIAPQIPNTPRDASAAAIICSALYELSTFTKEDGVQYKVMADQILENLSSSHYRARPGENDFFILKHSTGNWPGHREVDVPLIYSDYYFLEANLRKMRIEEGK